MKLSFTQIARDIPGAEGPCLDATGRLFMVCPNRGQVLQVAEDGSTREHANTGGTPAGLFADRENHLWVADMKLGILRCSPDGRLEHMVKEFEGAPIRGCNDLCLDGRGTLYFTAPAGSNAKKPIGEVYCRHADGSVTRIDQGYAFSNGIAVRADDSELIVAETFTKALWAFALAPDGTVGPKKRFAVLPGKHFGGPDGMDFDVEGNLLATNWGAGTIDVFARNGVLIERIECPFDKPSNVHFGGADGCDLYVTEHTTNGLWRTRWRYPGQPTIR
ncbi:MAG TPA: SMP-30/gluconolactonase/LRE family protein [Planctomycetota bacterium]|nr:SMP-30/gluconolactonase/LRE family protein [Planctomycetota bacterium]